MCGGSGSLSGVTGSPPRKHYHALSSSRMWNRSLLMNSEVMFPDLLVPHLPWWMDRNNNHVDVPFHSLTPSVALTTDESDKSWGHISGQSVARLGEGSSRWTYQPSQTQGSVQIPEKFHARLWGTTVLIQSDNTAVVAYINEWGTRSVSLCLLKLDMLL